MNLSHIQLSFSLALRSTLTEALDLFLSHLALFYDDSFALRDLSIGVATESSFSVSQFRRHRLDLCIHLVLAAQLVFIIMEPRARAGKNVGKETFQTKDLAALMYAYGDVPNPLPESVRVMDDILTQFLEGICFEATRHATVAGRQKLKFEDFEFSLRRQPEYLGKIKTMIDKRKEITRMRKAFQPDDDAVVNSHGAEDDGGPGGPGGKKRPAPTTEHEELLDDDDDDPDIVEAIRNQNKKRKVER
ncbi:hypothetical protein JX265_004977 [Neoarthrinium moseri]|uniref:Transcription initiation factor TFIID subunit 13 n=1 Tax=Neoarthrinium moseri TaxID=1658444 RepID=A0A9Q0AQN8_9PEZI|nr:hypothetical protein JX266_007397 [Neoarthrinium moseri]KAI1873355.1 hypothetical protein JX265_004977 [Neoarthrinium moseri]